MDTLVWATLNVDTPTLVSCVESKLDGRWSWRTVDGQVTETREELMGDGERRVLLAAHEESRAPAASEATVPAPFFNQVQSI